MNPLLGRVSRALEDHRERHRPSGFGFALADGIDSLDGESWDALTRPGTFFLGRQYLRALETDGPDNLAPRYALVFAGRRPVAAVAAQLVTVQGSRVAARLSKRLEARLVVCGNLLSWGQHGVAFARGVDPRTVWPGVAEALYRIRRAERLAGRTDFALVKDVADADGQGVEALARFGYRRLATDPDMVLDIPPAWKTFDDYLAGLHSKYRKNFLRVAKDAEAAGCRVEALGDLASEAERLHALYLQVHEAAAVKPVTVPPGYLPALARAAGADLRCTVIRRGGEVLGFATTLKDGETAVGYHLGFERSLKDELPLYFRLLQAVVADAIGFGCRRLSLGRTALEPKARLGARPVATSVWLRHAHPLVNGLVGRTLGAVPHSEAPERNPFKD